MTRRYIPQLHEWLTGLRRKPLLMRGARQVGKSTLVRQFAASEGRELFEINLELHPELERGIETLDPAKIIRDIELIYDGRKVDPATALVFIDEIQERPKMLQALRYFYEKMPELPIIAAGSLLEFALANHAFPMPVGRIEYFHVGPVSWEEYLAAVGDDFLLEILTEFKFGDYFPIAAHNKLRQRLREFILVGGMPEAVQTFIDEGDLEKVFKTQTAIINTYRDDFSKYATGANLARLQSVLDYLGIGSGQKVKYVNIDRNSQARETKSALDLIQKAGIVLRVNHSHGGGIPLAAEKDEKIFKLYSLDIGLLNRINGLERLREPDLEEERFINESQLAEQFLAQQLYFRKKPHESPSLHYWLREGRANNAEVDFLVQVKDIILPVEVKSGKSGTVRSLLLFGEQKKSPLLCRFDLNLPSLEPAKEGRAPFLSLPLYLCGQLDRLTSALLD